MFCLNLANFNAVKGENKMNNLFFILYDSRVKGNYFHIWWSIKRCNKKFNLKWVLNKMICKIGKKGAQKLQQMQRVWWRKTKRQYLENDAVEVSRDWSQQNGESFRLGKSHVSRKCLEFILKMRNVKRVMTLSSTRWSKNEAYLWQEEVGVSN